MSSLLGVLCLVIWYACISTAAALVLFETQSSIPRWIKLLITLMFVIGTLYKMGNAAAEFLLNEKIEDSIDE